MPETKAWPEGPIRATHRGHHRDEAPQSDVRFVRIAQQIAYAFGIEINKDVVRRVLAIHSRPKPLTDGPSWLTVIAQAKDSVWSVDLFRVESVVLRSHWVLLVMDMVSRPGESPSRPGELHPESLTEPCLTVSSHTARATH